jgi:hypothetical protein
MTGGIFLPPGVERDFRGAGQKTPPVIRNLRCKEAGVGAAWALRQGSSDIEMAQTWVLNRPFVGCAPPRAILVCQRLRAGMAILGTPTANL